MNRHHHDRREFLGLTGASVIGLASGRLSDAVAFAEKKSADVDPRYADLVLFNAKIYTVDPSMPKAEAFAVKGSRFLFVGSTAETKAFIGKGTRTFDAKQMTIMPGFIDCHNHADGNTLLYEVIVGNPYEVEFVRSPASSMNSAPKPTRLLRVAGSMDTSSTIPRSRTTASSMSTTSIRSRRSIRYASVIVAAIRLTTTAKRSSWLT